MMLGLGMALPACSGMRVVWRGYERREGGGEGKRGGRVHIYRLGV